MHIMFRSGMGVAVSVMNQNNERVLTDGEKTVFDYCKEGSLEKVMVLFDGFPKDEQVQFSSFHYNQGCHILEKSWKVLDFFCCPGKSLKVLEFCF